MSSAIKTPAFQAKAGNIQNEDNSSIYSGGAWSFKNASAVTGFHVASDGNVGIGTSSSYSSLVHTKYGAMVSFAGFNNNTARPTISGGTQGPYEIRGVGQNQLGDDGFLMLSAGAGTNASTKSYIAFSGYSQIPDMDRSIVFGTSGTERMRIDADGKVGIGTTSPAGLIHIQGSTDSAGQYGSNTALYLKSTSGSGGAGGSIIFGADTNTTAAGYGASVYYSNTTSNSSGSNGAICFATKSLNTDTALTERMRIAASGNVTLGVNGGKVGIGTSSPSAALDVTSSDTLVSEFNGTNASNTSEIIVRSSGGVGNNTRGRIIAGYEAGGANYGGFLAFNTTSTSNVNTERIRLDASGNLLFNTTSSFDASDNSNTNSNIASFSLSRPLQAESSGGSAAAFKRKGGDGVVVYFARGGVGVVGSISVTTTGTSYNPASDARLKDNIEPLNNALETIKKLQPRKYTWKVNGSSDDGFIAQELQQIPEFAHRVNEIGERDGETYYGVDYMRFVTYLTAAVQELSAKVDAQAEEIKALKAK